MEQLTFKQNKWFSSRNFILDKQYLSIKQKTIKDEKSWKVRLDNIGNQKYYYKESKKPGIIASIICWGFCAFFTTAYLIHGINANNDINTFVLVNSLFFLIGLFFILKRTKNEVIIIGGQENVAFFFDRKNEKEIIEFVDLVISYANNYILEQFGKIDPDLSEETQMNRLQWLRSREIISESEYNNMKQEYRIKKII